MHRGRKANITVSLSLSASPMTLSGATHKQAAAAAKLINCNGTNTCF